VKNYTQNETPRNLTQSTRHSLGAQNSKGAVRYSAPARLRKTLGEVEIDQVEFDSDVIKATLSPSMWESGKLKPEVRKKLTTKQQKHITTT